MNTRALCITVLVFTVLIFWGNHHTVQSNAQGKGSCNDCKCTMAVNGVPLGRPKPFDIKDYQYTPTGPFSTGEVMTYSEGYIKEREADKAANRKRREEEFKKESCSVVFRNQSGKLVTQNLGAATVTNFSCGVAVFCGKPRQASLICGRNYFDVGANVKCSMNCMPGGKTWSSCEFWKRPTTPEKKGATSPPRTNTPAPIFFASLKMSNFFASSFLPAKYNLEPTVDEEVSEVIATSTRWRLLDGEAGFDKGIFTIASGEAEVQSFCTGDTIRLAGPNVITLPTCPVDISGRWQGAYTRRLPLETGPAVTVSLELRNESGALRGELKTSDGTFSIVSARQNDTGFQLEADGAVAGQQRKIILNGKLTKGDIVFDGTESGIAEKPLKLLGAVRRLYIADSGLRPAVLNQPYNFKLTAISPDSEAITFRLASGRLPRGISFDASSGTLNGTPGEIGIFSIRIAVADAIGNGFEQPLTLNVKKLVITTRLLPDAFFGQSYSATLKVAGGQPPYKFSGFPPKGLTLDPNTGELSGIPTSNRHELSSFTIRDSQNNSETQDVSLHVRRTTILTPHFLPEATQGFPYRTELKAVGNNIPTKWSIPGGFDIKSIGLTLNPQTGELSGTPTKSGEFLLLVAAVTTSVDQQDRNFTLTVKQNR